MCPVIKRGCKNDDRSLCLSVIHHPTQGHPIHACFAVHQSISINAQLVVSELVLTSYLDVLLEQHSRL